MKSTCYVAALVLSALSCSSAFAPLHSLPRQQAAVSSQTALSMAVINKNFGRAVECAENFGLCDASEMADLADKLDDYEGCVYEDGKEMCEKEMQDRKDVAETLRMAAELQLRMDYLKNANLFAEDVHKELDMEKTEKSWADYKELHGSGLGL